MENGVTTSKQLDVLFESGAELSREFAEEQWARQQQWEKEQGKEQGEWQDRGGVRVRIADEDADEGTEKREEPEEDEREVAARARKAVEFDFRYQRWYSIALALMKQLAPDRWAEFQAYYQPHPKREAVDATNYTIQDWFRHRGFECDEEDITCWPWSVVVRCFLNQLAILKSVKDRLEWQAYTTDDQAERALQLDILEAARSLIEVSERAAGALAGRVLDT